MNNEKNRQENKRALKIFIPIIIIAAIVGGFIGVMANVSGAEDIASDISAFLRETAYLIAPYGVVTTVVVGISLSLYFYKSAEKEFLQARETGDPEQELSETALSSLDRKISMGMLTVSIVVIVSFIFFAIVIAYIDRYVDKDGTLLITAMVFFIAGSFGGTKMQQMMVDFEKILSPEKRGSVYDMKFTEKWEDSCDEMEKLMIYKASYKAYKTANISCGAAFFLMVILSFFFDYGPLPAVVVGSVWLTVTVSYCLEAMKLDKNKINE